MSGVHQIEYHLLHQLNVLTFVLFPQNNPAGGSSSMSGSQGDRGKIPPSHDVSHAMSAKHPRAPPPNQLPPTKMVNSTHHHRPPHPQSHGSGQQHTSSDKPHPSQSKPHLPPPPDRPNKVGGVSGSRVAHQNSAIAHGQQQTGK